MPFEVAKIRGGWAVKSPKGIKGKHKTLEGAQAQQKAIYANWKGKE